MKLVIMLVKDIDYVVGLECIHKTYVTILITFVFE